MYGKILCNKIYKNEGEMRRN